SATRLVGVRIGGLGWSSFARGGGGDGALRNRVRGEEHGQRSSLPCGRQGQRWLHPTHRARTRDEWGTVRGGPFVVISWFARCDFGARTRVGFGEALGEGFNQRGLFGPGIDEDDFDLRRIGCIDGIHQREAVEAGGGTRVLRSEADGEHASDSGGPERGNYVRGEGVPVAHGDVDGQRAAGFLQRGL